MKGKNPLILKRFCSGHSSFCPLVTLPGNPAVVAERSKATSKFEWDATEGPGFEYHLRQLIYELILNYRRQIPPSLKFERGAQGGG